MSYPIETIHSGTITTKPDIWGNMKFIASSHLEPKVLECWTYKGAAFYLWIIESRIKAYEYRTGRAYQYHADEA